MVINCSQQKVFNLYAAQRVMQRIDKLATFSAHCQQLTRVYLSPEHSSANQQVGQWMQSVGMTVWQDAVGNICGRYEGHTSGAKAILLGSHLDTVKNAGRFDGMLGVLTAIEVVADLHHRQVRLPMAIEIIGFADEEGTRFGVTLLGSKGLTANWEANWLQQTDADGVSIAQALLKFGLDPDKIAAAVRRPESIHAYLELHIEQGPCLEQLGKALGVVQAINGARRLRCEFIGEAGHAGTVPMQQRRDALQAAAEWMLFIEQTTLQAGGQQVATVGDISVTPGAVNVIPGNASLALDIRGPNDEKLDALLAILLDEANHIAAKRGVNFSSNIYYSMQATACCNELQQQLRRGVTKVQGDCVELVSGAGHDAIAIAEQWPVAMLFVRCTKGISHHPAEDVQLDDIALAISAFREAVNLVATEA